MKLLSNGKLAAGVLTAVAASALLLAGTFAWMNFTKVTNNFLGDGENNGGTLHDDFCAPKKDVYIENWGDSTIYVRLKLFEYMEIGQGAGKYQTINGERVHDPDNHADSLMPFASISDQSTWSPHIPYQNQVNICNTEAKFHDYWNWSMGGWKYYRPAPAPDRANPAYVDQNAAQYNSGSGMPKTLDATVVTMETWKNMGGPIGSYWVIDTDGWAYWAAPLSPSTATGLLLHSVNLITKPNDAYYYGINVWAQMATKDGSKDGGEWNYNNFGDSANDGWTQDGHDLMDEVTGSGGGNGGATSTPTPAPAGSTNITASAPAIVIGNRIFIEQGAETTLTANTTGSPVTWNLPNNSGTIASDVAGDNQATVTIDSAAATGGRYSVKAANQANSGDSDTKYITIIPAGSSVVTGLDGNPYLDNGDNTFNRIYDNGTLGPLVCPPSNTNHVKGKPGGSNDRTDVVIGSDGNTKYLGPNDDGSYNKAGPDGLLGTPDDVKVWPSDPSKPIGPGNESETPPVNATQVQISQTGATAVLGNNYYVKRGASVNLTANTSGTNVTWADQGKSGFTLTPGGKTAVVSSNANIGAKDVISVSVNGMPDNNDARTIVVVPTDAVGVVIGQDSNTYIDYGDNTFRRLNDDGSLGPWVCPPSDTNYVKGVPGGPDDRKDITVSGGVKYLGPNGDDSYQKAGPDGLLGTPDDVIVYQKDTTKPIAPDNESPVKVLPVTDTPDGVDGRILPAAKAGDSSNWIEIARNGNYSLIVRQNYINTYGNGHDGDPLWNIVNFYNDGITTNYGNSNLRGVINGWFNGTASLGDKLGANANLRNFTVTNSVMSKFGTMADPAKSMTDGFSKPTTVKSGTGYDVAFALSYSESANFCSTVHDLRNTNPEVQPSGDIAIANAKKMIIPLNYGAWLRSIGDITGTAGQIYHGGDLVRAFQQYDSQKTGLVYPALWVDSSIFN